MSVLNLACVIDDDPIYSYYMNHTINSIEMCKEVIFFENGKDAFDSLQKKHANNEALPELIFLDLNMPIWDGWQFLDEFKEIETDEKIVIYIVTSSINEDDISKAKSYNIVSNYVIKPVSRDQMKELISNAASIA